MVSVKNVKLLSFVVVILALITSGVGLFYKTDGHSFTVQNIYNQSIELYGNGIYAYDSVFKATINKGTDLAMLLVISLFLISTILYNKSDKTKFLHAGLLLGIMYYATSISFGVVYNQLFPVYILLFSASFYLTILSLRKIILDNNIPDKLKNKTLKGTGIFLIIGGCSVLIWLTAIIPAFLTGNPIETIDIYTTEPTFILDLGIILPITVFTGVMLIKQKMIGYKLAPILLTLMIIIGLIVVSQTFIQLQEGIKLPIGQMFGMVISFVTLAFISIILNVKFLKQL